MLEVRNVSYAIDGKNIIRDISARFVPNQLHVIVGPNGSGKSTLLKAISGDLKLNSGSVYYGADDISIQSKLQLAKRRAVMTQLPELHFPLSVDDVVMMGRYPHFTYRPSMIDIDICNLVMRRLSIEQFADRDYLSLSGGEKQRIQFARALGQVWEIPESGCRYLFLDEPVSSLDIYYQHQFLQMLQLLKNEDTVLVAVLHDINLAIEYADRMIFMKNGVIVEEGNPGEILSEKLIKTIFDVPVSIMANPYSSAPMVVYRP